VKSLLLIGKDAPLFEKAFGTQVDCQCFDSLDEAVARAQWLALSGDTVLLSPACSSLDMYKNYLERGDHFKQLVHDLSEVVYNE
jgi:UDP-N-acetylmuramoylalanine--D-glutamate ligase